MGFRRAAVLFLTFLMTVAFAGEAHVAAAGEEPAFLTRDEPGEPLYPKEPPVRRHDVYDLKVRLKQLGYYTGPLDDYYDQAAILAVKRFQKAYWLDATGTVDIPTWRALAHGVVRPSRPATGPPPEGEIRIEIDTEKLTLTLFCDEKEWRTYPIAAGRWETMTPVGEWRIVDKGERVGGPFGSRWMALDVPWGNYGIHGTSMPWTIGGYFSSGCVRMFNEDVEEVFDLVPSGTLVTVKGYLPKMDFTQKIGLGSVAPEVVLLQQRLREEGFDPGRCDGRYGSATDARVRDIATVYGLSTGKNMVRDVLRLLGLL